MGNVGPGMLGSVLFLILGLQPLPLSQGRFLHHPPNSRSFQLGSRHHGSSWEKLKSCEGAFDLYFVVDASQKAKDIWEDICQLVDEITTKYTNPDLRMSFITYSTQGNIVMKLTSDRTKIRDGLKRLQDIVPTGATNMQEGLKKANKQIQQATSGDRSTSSLIITLTAGPLLPRTLQDTKKEAQQARDMGAKVYCVGVKDYERDQLNDIVERKDQMYGTEEFNSAETFVTSLVKNSCMEAMAGDTHFVCLGVAYEVTFFASGLDRKRKDEIVCRYHLGSGKVFDKKPISMNQGKLICPGHIFDKAGQEVFIDYSLNNGVSFVGEDLKIVSKDCLNDRVGLREPQWTAAWEEEAEDAGASWEEEYEPTEPTTVPTTTTTTTKPTTDNDDDSDNSGHNNDHNNHDDDSDDNPHHFHKDNNLCDYSCHPETGSQQSFLVCYFHPLTDCDPIGDYLYLLLQEGHQGATISPKTRKAMPCTDHSGCLLL
ncbi:hypothetical protein CapIbe_021848 [Capra ibex]